MGKAYLQYEGGQIYVDEMWSPLVMKGIHNFEPEKVRFIKEHIRPGHTFIDVGACEGFYSLLAARFVGDDGRVVAIEPNETNYVRLRESVRINGYHNIQTTPYAIDTFGRKEGGLFLSQQVGRHTLRGKPKGDFQKGTQAVVIMSLDDTMEELGIDNFVGGMKIDVEGYELKVLNGGRMTLQQCSYVAIDVHRAYGINRLEVEKFLIGQGFDIEELSVKELGARPNEIFAVRENTLSP